MPQKFWSLILMICLLPMPQVHAGESVISLPAGQAGLPVPGTMVHLSAPTNPVLLKGIKVHQDNPFKFEFVIDKGTVETPLMASNTTIENESKKLIKYFLAALTIPEKDLWVNLSPYEKDRIVPESFGQTQMGRDLLAQDYILKQITASLIYPEDTIGKEFWRRVYEASADKNTSINTFNKVWIVPNKAKVYENANAGTAYVVESSLKVLTEQDYVATNKNTVQTRFIASQSTQNIIKDIVIPQLTKEVNEGANFAQLRQVYNALILATWYKKKIKDSILAQAYADKNKIAGTQYQDNLNPEQIYARYLEAFKKGAFNYIKETDMSNGITVPRKYFSGGANLQVSQAMTASDKEPVTTGHEFVVEAKLESPSMKDYRERLKNEYYHALSTGQKVIDITAYLGSAAVKGLFNDGFVFELDGFKPGNISNGLGHGKVEDRIIMEDQGDQRIFKRIRKNAKYPDGNIVVYSIWHKTQKKDEHSNGMVWERDYAPFEDRSIDIENKSPFNSKQRFYEDIEREYKDFPGTIGIAKLIFEVNKLEYNKSRIGSLVGKRLRPTNSDGSSTFSLIKGKIKIPVLGTTDDLHTWDPVIVSERMDENSYEFTVQSTTDGMEPIERTFRIGKKTKQIMWRGRGKTIYVIEPVDRVPVQVMQRLIDARKPFNVTRTLEALKAIEGQNIDVTEDTGQIKVFFGNGEFYRWAVLGMRQAGWKVKVLGAKPSRTGDSIILSMILNKLSGQHVIKVFEFGKKVAISKRGFKHFVMEPVKFKDLRQAMSVSGSYLKNDLKLLSFDMTNTIRIVFADGNIRSNKYLVSYSIKRYQERFGKKVAVGAGRVFHHVQFDKDEVDDEENNAMLAEDFPHPGNKTRVNELKVEAHDWLVKLLRREYGNSVAFETLVDSAKDKSFYLGKLGAGKIVLPIYADKDYTRQLLDSSFSKKADERSGWETWLTNVRMLHGSVWFNFVLIKREMVDGVEQKRKIVQEYVVNPYITRDVLLIDGKDIDVLEIVKAENFPSRMLSAFMLRPNDFEKLKPMMLALQGSFFGLTHTAGEVLFAVPNKLYPEKNLFLIDKSAGVEDKTQWHAVMKKVNFHDQVVDFTFGVSKDDTVLPDVNFQASPALQELSVNIHDKQKTLDVMTLDKRLAVRGLEKFALFGGSAQDLIKSGFTLKGTSFGEVNAAGAVSITPWSGHSYAVPISGLKDNGGRVAIIDEYIYTYSQGNKIRYEFTASTIKDGEMPFLRKFIASKNVGDSSFESFDIQPDESFDAQQALEATLKHIQRLNGVKIKVTSGENPRLRVINRKFGLYFHSIYFQGLQPGTYDMKVQQKGRTGEFKVTMKGMRETLIYRINADEQLNLETNIRPSGDDIGQNEFDKFILDFRSKHPNDWVQAIRQDDQKLRVYWKSSDGNIYRTIVTEDFLKSLGYRNVKFKLLEEDSKEYALVKDAIDTKTMYATKHFLKVQAQDEFPQEYLRNKEGLKRIYAATPAVVGLSQLMFEGIKGKESKEVLKSLVGQTLPITDKQGRSIFAIFPNFSINLSVIGTMEAGWQPTVSKVGINELGYFEFTIRSTKEGKVPVERTFEIGRFKKKFTWNNLDVFVYNLISVERIRLIILKRVVKKKGRFNAPKVSVLLNQLRGVDLGPSLPGGQLNIYLSTNKRMAWYFASEAGRTMRILDARVSDANDSVLITTLIEHTVGSYSIRVYELGKEYVVVKKGLEHYTFNPVSFNNQNQAIRFIKPAIIGLDKPLARDPFLSNVVLEFPDVLEKEKVVVIHNGEYYSLFPKEEKMYVDRTFSEVRRVLQERAVRDFIQGDAYNALPLNRRLGAFIKFIRSNEYFHGVGNMGKIWNALQKLEDEELENELDWGKIGGYSILYKDYERLVSILEQKEVSGFIEEKIVKGHIIPKLSIKFLRRHLLQEHATFMSRIPLMDLYLAIPMQYRSHFARPDAAMLTTSESNTGGIDLTADQMNLQTKSQDQQSMAFHMDPAQLAQVQNAEGFEPVIVSVLPLTDLHAFLTR